MEEAQKAQNTVVGLVRNVSSKAEIGTLVSKEIPLPDPEEPNDQEEAAKEEKEPSPLASASPQTDAPTEVPERESPTCRP